MKKRKARRRYIEIVKELSRMSHNGWAFAGPMDYGPLERELRKLRAVLFGPEPKLALAKARRR